jgi:hypothetical protein
MTVTRISSSTLEEEEKKEEVDDDDDVEEEETWQITSTKSDNLYRTQICIALSS